MAQFLTVEYLHLHNQGHGQWRRFTITAPSEAEAHRVASDLNWDQDSWVWEEGPDHITDHGAS